MTAPDLFTRKLNERRQTTPDWPPLIPLDGNTTNLPPFPTHTLPNWIADMVYAVADELQVATDLPATLALAALATTTAGHIEIAIRDTWHEPTNLYLVVALPPGAGKSPAFKAMIGPLETHQTNLRHNAETRIAALEQQRRILTTAMKRAEDKGDTNEARNLLQELHELQIPHRPRLIIDDATPEALVARLHEQNGRLALMSSEGGLFDMITGRYNERTNLDPYLQAWSGDTINVDRIGRESITITKPLLTIGLTVQPTVIERLAARPELAGRGLTARFMYAIPHDTVGYRDMTRPDTPTNPTRNHYNQQLTHIAETLHKQPSQTLQLTPDAAQIFNDWRQHIEHRRRPDGDLYNMREWTTKLESSVARTAAILTTATNPHNPGPVTAQTLNHAITIGRYWIEHARAVHGAWCATPIQSDALHIWQWLQTRGHTQISERDLWRGVRRRFDEIRENMNPALQYLTESGHIRRTTVTTTGDTNGDTKSRKQATIIVRPPETDLIVTMSPLSQETKINDLSIYRKTGQTVENTRSPSEPSNAGDTGDMVTPDATPPNKHHTEWSPEGTDEEGYPF